MINNFKFYNRIKLLFKMNYKKNKLNKVQKQKNYKVKYLFIKVRSWIFHQLQQKKNSYIKFN